MNHLIELLSSPQSYVSLTTLTLMEIVLGIDNVIFVSIIVGKLPPASRGSARTLGLAMALVFRIILLSCLSWIAGLTTPVLTIFSHAISGRDIILLIGGLFLIAKSTSEIHSKIEKSSEAPPSTKASYWSLITQIALIDVVFSFDSVITAVGLVQELPIMILAVLLSMVIMIVASGSVSAIIEKHPTIKILALSFLLMIGTMLVMEGFHVHVDKGYIYFAMAFSIAVEVLNIKMRSAKHDPN